MPSFAEIFAGFGAELPAFTQLVIHISEWMQQYWWLVLAAIIAAVYSFKKAYRHNLKFKTAADAMALKLPVMGMIINKAAVARYARTLSTTFAGRGAVN